ncbi:MAG TPA: hypothetical protein VK421_10350 [Pyrinomonadaceae bacterium]|nr:hypothetical protein [Pyrinomonadaceae bacterium]
MRALTVSFFALLLLCPAAPAHQTGAVALFAVMDEVDRVAAADLWPGFDPRRIPAAIFDGQNTILFRHPQPPEGFVSLSSRQGVWAFAGRHESVTANVAVKLNGVWTATVLLTLGRERTTRDAAALVIHEMFHAFQRERHADWQANELELFVYPFDDAEVLRLRRLESEALRRAADAARPRDASCWAATAIDLRRARFERMPKGSVTYERVSELNEGLAEYVEARAAGRRGSGLPAVEFAAEGIRERVYKSGRALAVLLDRFSPRWKQQLEAGEKRSLDELLAAALPRDTRARCELPSPLQQATKLRAQGDVSKLNSEREAARRDYLARDGWQLVLLSAEGLPLWPQGFDPLNLRRLTAAELLHTRHLKLGNDAGAIEILGRAALTEGAGEHPLFNGVRRLSVVGLPAEPAVEESAGRVKVTAADLKADFRSARVSRDGRTLTVQLTGPPQ